MLKISIVDTSNQRRLVLEGALIPPWAAELHRACELAREDLDGRELMVDLENLVAISEEGESILLALANDRVKLRAHGVFTKHLLRQITRHARRKLPETTSGRGAQGSCSKGEAS